MHRMYVVKLPKIQIVVTLGGVKGEATGILCNDNNFPPLVLSDAFTDIRFIMCFIIFI